MLYRLYQHGDFAALYAVEELCFQPPFRFSRAYMSRVVSGRDAATNSATWIVEEDAQLIGFAVVKWARRRGDKAAHEAAAYIETLEVHPKQRRRGIGRELLRLVESSARSAGANSILLHVDQENASAIRLYESRGYMRQGREEHYYARNRAALVYTKDLSERADAA